MKKIAFLFLSLLLVACSSDDDFSYSEKQQKIFETLIGSWEQTGDNPDYFTFQSPYKEPNEIKEDNGSVFYAQGICTYKEYWMYDRSYRTHNCFYWISSDGFTLRLWDAENNYTIDVYSLTVEGDNIRLINKDPNHLGNPIKLLVKK